MWSGKLQDWSEIILYEDKEIIVCHKPAGTAVQNSRIGSMDMESMMKNYLAVQNPGKIPYLGIVHRLDQPVEGLLVFAKTRKAAAELSRQISQGMMDKYYLAVSDKKAPALSGVLEDYMKKDGRTNTSTVVDRQTPGAKKARLSYELVEELLCKRYLYRIHLDTGRHHQIRVQMSHGGMPLLGDRKYNGKADGQNGISLGLCAWHLEFVHPVTKRKMQFETKPQGNAFEGFDLKNTAV